MIRSQYGFVRIKTEGTEKFLNQIQILYRPNSSDAIPLREIFAKHKEVKKFLWGGNLWTSSFYANTVSEYANADGIQQYIANQGAYKKILEQQLSFDF